MDPSDFYKENVLRYTGEMRVTLPRDHVSQSNHTIAPQNNLSVTDRHTHGHTDGRTDRRTETGAAAGPQPNVRMHAKHFSKAFAGLRHTDNSELGHIQVYIQYWALLVLYKTYPGATFKRDEGPPGYFGFRFLFLCLFLT